MHLKNQNCPDFRGELGVRNLMKRIPTLVPTQENQGIRLQGRRPPWAPTSCYIHGLHPGSPRPENMTMAEGVAAGRPNQLGWGKRVRGGETRDQEKLSLLAQPGSGLMTLQLRHQICFHGNPGGEGAFILASEFTLF